MEPTPLNIATFMFPTAVCTRNPTLQPEAVNIPWPDSSLNPKNRIDSLEPLGHATWAVDGCDRAGTRFFAIPHFARGKPPLRIDTYIPEIHEQPGYLRDVLRPSFSLFQDSSKASASEMSRHIVRALEAWSKKYPDFEEEYFSRPFGSQIIIENIACHPQDMKIHLLPIFNVERQWLSLKQLQQMWHVPPGGWPETIDHEQLQLQRQVHDTVAWVSIAAEDGRTEDYVFKALTDDLKYFYHELKLLIHMIPHPNIISRPRYIVTKRSRFGGKVGVCGMLLERHHPNNLRQILMGSPPSPSKSLVVDSIKTQVTWAKQIVAALIHVRDHGPGFYTNLKLDNIVLAQDGDGDGDTGIPRVVLIDFEQRLGSPAWTPPEIHYITYLIELATKSTSQRDRERYRQLLRDSNIEFQSPPKSALYSNPTHGYSDPWPSLSPTDQEAAQAYMMGMLLWCLFEKATLLNTHIGINSFGDQAPDLNFPEFQRTPPPLRELILQCTAGSEESRGRTPPLVVKNGWIWLNTHCHTNEGVTAETVQVAARAWWRQQILDAEEFVRSRTPAAFFSSARPTLQHVFDVLLEQLSSIY